MKGVLGVRPKTKRIKLFNEELLHYTIAITMVMQRTSGRFIVCCREKYQIKKEMND